MQGRHTQKKVSMRCETQKKQTVDFTHHEALPQNQQLGGNYFEVLLDLFKVRLDLVRLEPLDLFKVLLDLVLLELLDLFMVLLDLFMELLDLVRLELFIVHLDLFMVLLILFMVLLILFKVLLILFKVHLGWFTVLLETVVKLFYMIRICERLLQSQILK